MYVREAQMNGLAGFGDVLDTLESIPGEVTGAASTYAQQQISAIVTPYIAAMLFLSLAGFAFGLAAFLQVRKLRRS